MGLLTGTGLGLLVLLVVWYSRGPEEGAAIIGGTLLNMAVFGAMISYTLQGLSFILLRVKLPLIPRPYRSPFGITGAAITIVIALWTMYYQFRDPAYVKGVYAALAWYVAGLAYFGFVGRHRLVLSPEEQFALSKGAQAVGHLAEERTSEEGEESAVLPPTVA
jgi:ethanolamine permease